MPLSKKDRKLKSSFTKQYGDDGKSIYYATMQKRINEGRPINTPESHKLASKRKHKRAKNKRRSSKR